MCQISVSSRQAMILNDHLFQVKLLNVLPANAIYVSGGNSQGVRIIMVDEFDKVHGETAGSTLAFTAQIVSAHVANNAVQASALPDLIQQVYSALNSLGGSTVVAEKPQPAVPVKKSVFPDYIICLEDGKKLKMLKRHLMTSYGMSAEDYRQRWNLPSDYPMVAPNYAQHRSSLAKSIGLGRKPSAGDAAPVDVTPTPAKLTRRGRKAQDHSVD